MLRNLPAIFQKRDHNICLFPTNASIFKNVLRSGTGAESEQDCKACPPGYYCETPGLSAPTGKCAAGTLCLERATDPAPRDGLTGAYVEVEIHCSAEHGKGNLAKCADTSLTATCGSQLLMKPSRVAHAIFG